MQTKDYALTLANNPKLVGEINEIFKNHFGYLPSIELGIRQSRDELYFIVNESSYEKLLPIDIVRLSGLIKGVIENYSNSDSMLEEEEEENLCIYVINKAEIDSNVFNERFKKEEIAFSQNNFSEVKKILLDTYDKDLNKQTFFQPSIIIEAQKANKQEFFKQAFANFLNENKESINALNPKEKESFLAMFNQQFGIETKSKFGLENK